MEDGDVPGSGFLQGEVGPLHHLHGGHAGREDDRFSAGSDVPEEGNVGDISRADFHQRHAQPQEEVDVLRVVSGGEKGDADGVTVLLDGLEFSVSQLQRLQHLVLGLLTSGVGLLVIGLLRVRRNDFLRHVLKARIFAMVMDMSRYDEGIKETN